MQEDALLTGDLEPTNEPYAIAKIAGIKLCEAIRKEYQFDAISIAMHRVVTVGSMRTGVIELNGRIDWPTIWVMPLAKAWCL